MKKLRKILATISTVTLMSCVWGVNTHAEVKKNDLGVPTHIEADNHAEFLRDLKKVLPYITANLEVKDEETIDLLTNRCNDWISAGLKKQPANTYEEKSSYEYEFVLTKTRMTYFQSISYLYQLLRKSTIKKQNLTNVWVLFVDYETPSKEVFWREIIFQLPAVFSEYCTCCMRWHLIPDTPGQVGPWFLQDSFSQEFKERKDRVDCLALSILDPNEEFESDRDHWYKKYSRGNWSLQQEASDDRPTTRYWRKLKIQTKDISKLISISTVNTSDEDLVKRFLADKNWETDFARFKEQDDAGREMFTPK